MSRVIYNGRVAVFYGDYHGVPADPIVVDYITNTTARVYLELPVVEGDSIEESDGDSTLAVLQRALQDRILTRDVKCIDPRWTSTADGIVTSNTEFLLADACMVLQDYFTSGQDFAPVIDELNIILDELERKRMDIYRSWYDPDYTLTLDIPTNTPLGIKYRQLLDNLVIQYPKHNPTLIELLRTKMENVDTSTLRTLYELDDVDEMFPTKVLAYCAETAMIQQDLYMLSEFLDSDDVMSVFVIGIDHVKNCVETLVKMGGKIVTAK